MTVALHDLMTPAEVEAATGIPESTRRRYINAGRFPPPVPISARFVGYLRTDIDRWLQQNGRRERASRGGAAVFRLARRFKHRSEAEHLASFVSALGPVIEMREGFFEVTVTTPKAAAFERYVRHATPYEAWQRVEERTP